MSEGSGISTREELIQALTAVAELEHGVICQYLFAAFSLKRHPDEGGITWAQLERVRAWQASILLVARQEMEHLGLVCNLLSAVGGVPHFTRPDFPQPAPFCSALPALTLEPFSDAALKQFLQIEQAHTLPAVSNGGAADLRAQGETIGGWYSRIRDGFTELAGENAMLFVGPTSAQVSNASLDLSKGLYDINLSEVLDLETACRAIDQILELSLGASDDPVESHYDRFERIRTELLEVQRKVPRFEPARPVVSNPVIRAGEAGGGRHVTPIEHPLTARAAALFNDAYTTMLLMLTRFYAPHDETVEEREGLKRIAFFPMMTMVIRPLGEILTQMPVGPTYPGPTAGPTFECRRPMHLPPYRRGAWVLLHERLQYMAEESLRINEDLGRLHAPWAACIRPRLATLCESMEAMALNFERFMGLKQERLQHLIGRIL